MSWSQVNTWERDPNEYHNVYVLGLSIPQTSALILGKYVADELEKDKSKDPLIEHYREFTPHCEIREYPMNEKLEEHINLKSFFDGFNEDKKEIIEIKTGASWTQRKVDKHGQLDFYALQYYLRYKELPKSIRLVWLETKKDENFEVYLTGNFKVFNREIRIKDILSMINRIKKADEGITKMYECLNA